MSLRMKVLVESFCYEFQSMFTDFVRSRARTSATVVPLHPRATTYRYPHCNRVETFLDRLAQPGTLPRRQSINPSGIASSLSHVMVLTRISPRHARIRHAGQHILDLMGMSADGMPLSAIFEPNARESIASTLETVFDRPAVARIALRGERGYGRPLLEGLMLLYPMHSDHGDRTHVICCLETRGDTGRAPRRFSAETVSLRTLGILGDQADRSEKTTDRGWKPRLVVNRD